MNDPVWAKIGRTGVFHADPDCPAVRDTVADAPAGGYRNVYELDRAAKTAWLWQWSPGSGGWIRAADDPDHYDNPYLPATFRFMPSRWRPCLRCGSVRGDGTYGTRRQSGPRTSGAEPTPCTRCNLTICDCEN